MRAKILQFWTACNSSSLWDVIYRMGTVKKKMRFRSSSWKLNVAAQFGGLGDGLGDVVPESAFWTGFRPARKQVYLRPSQPHFAHLPDSLSGWLRQESEQQCASRCPWHWNQPEHAALSLGRQAIDFPQNERRRIRNTNSWKSNSKFSVQPKKLTKLLSAFARGALLSANAFVKQHAVGDFDIDAGGLERLDFLESA